MPSIELKSISGKGIKSLVLFQKPSIYAVISLTNVNQPSLKKNKKKTTVDRSNGENPVWDQPIRVDIISHNQELILEFDLKAEALLGDRIVGRAFIPVADLDFSGAVQHVSYQVKTPEGKANGFIHFSYKIDGLGTAVPPPIVPGSTPAVDYSPPAGSIYPPPHQPEAASGYYPTVNPVVSYPPPQSCPGYPGASYPPLPPQGGYPPQPDYCCREIPQPAPNVAGYYPPPAYPPQPQPVPNVSGYYPPPGSYYPPPVYPPQPECCCREIPQPAPNVGGYYPPPGSYYPPPPPPHVYGYRQQGWD